jgi:hypothetical protein
MIKSSRLREAEHAERIKHRRGAYRVLVERLEENRQLERRRHRWEDNIKMDLQVACWRDMV